jgi:ATP-dependent Lon protease
VLPLHIFESRYREMLEDAVQHDQLITMATLQPDFDYDYYSRPPISPVVCIGRVAEHKKTERGTYNLILVGLRRATVQDEIEPVRAFRRAQVQLIEDSFPEKAKQLESQIVHQIRQAVPLAKDLIDKVTDGQISFPALIDVLAFHLPIATEVKLQLLAESDVMVRATTLLHSIPQTEPPEPGRGNYPTDFSAN